MSGTMCELTQIPRLRQPLDPFFEEGDLICHLQVSGQKQAIVDIDSEELLHPVYKTYECLEGGCSATFDSIASYESHYNNVHHNICSVCRKSYPTDHLLDLHLREEHDAYFQSQSERGQAVFCCFVKGCQTTFSSHQQRHDHIITVHKFPHDFRYGQRSKKVQQEGQSCSRDSQQMETDDVPSNKGNERAKKPVPKVPKNICFGQGSSRAFYKPPTAHKGNKKRSKNTSITMTDLGNALEDI